MTNIKNDILHCGILIVEDDYLGRVILREIFKKQGFTRIEEAENGKQALGKIESFKPDLVILDVIMPEMDGVECCKRIRAHAEPHISHVPVLFQTSLDGMADKARLFAAGATDYLTKPIDPHEITSRAVVHMEREVMTRRLREFNARVSQELDMARSTQRVLIPDNKLIADTQKDYGLHICSHYQPSSELGGDFWGMKSLSSEELAIYMVDFSGHGVNAALNVFRLHALMQAAMDTAKAPGAYLSHLNAILAPLLPVGQFCTMFYGVINTKQNTLSYASAAAPPPVLVAKNSESYTLLKNSGGLLGAFKETAFQTTNLTFNIGDCLMLYSDALIETPGESNSMQPIEHWASGFQRNMKEHANDCGMTFSVLLEAFQQRCGIHLTDDLTLATFLRI